MSAKSKPAPTPRGLPKNTVLIAVGVIAVTVILIGLVLITSQSTPPYTPEVQGAPHAEVATTVIDHGDMQMEAWAESVYTIQNTGSQTLRILEEPRVELVQGCCPPRAIVSQMTLRPGEQTTITLRYTMHNMMGGPHEFRVHVPTNDPTQSTILLTSLSNWIE